MTRNFGVIVAGLVASALYATSALAQIGGYGGGEDGGGGTASTPEIDGPGAVMAVALLVSLGIMIYRKAQK